MTTSTWIRLCNHTYIHSSVHQQHCQTCCEGNDCPYRWPSTSTASMQPPVLLEQAWYDTTAVPGLKSLRSLNYPTPRATWGAACAFLTAAPVAA